MQGIYKIKRPTYWQDVLLVEEGGFEPPKRIATDLQSAKYFPFPLRRNSSATYRPVLPMHYPNIF